MQIINFNVDPDTERLIIDIDKDTIPCTVGLYKFFYKHKAWDAFRLYMHLFFTYRLQSQKEEWKKNIWANNSYLVKGLGLGISKIKRAKRFLNEYGLISYVREKPRKGRNETTECHGKARG